MAASSSQPSGQSQAHWQKTPQNKRQRDDQEVNDQEPAKKQKTSRSRLACLPCRSRKSKCGTVPPNICAACRELGIACVWPAEDGRSATARQRRLDRGNGHSGWTRNSDQNVTDGSTALVQANVPNNAYHHLPTPQAFDMQNWNVEAVIDAAPFFPSSGHGGVFDANAVKIMNMLTPEPVLSNAGRSRMARITWRRPHGQTAIAPGFKRITLKVRISGVQSDKHLLPPSQTTSSDATSHIIDAQGHVALPIMRHLLDIFITRMGSMFPFLERERLEHQLENRRGSRFLFTSIAAVAARFSTHPAIALPQMEPHACGTIFTNKAKSMLGSMLAVPSRETVAALILMALVAAGDDSESEVWMFVGMAVRMSLDLGLHLTHAEEPDVSAEDCRRDRLLFWSTFMIDCALSFGVGRQTTFPLTDISQDFPTQEDITPGSLLSGSSTDPVRSPFPFAAQLFMHFAPLINLLNVCPAAAAQVETSIRNLRVAVQEEYERLPGDMQCDAETFKSQSRSGNALIFSWMHLWTSAILTNEITRSSEHPDSRVPHEESGAAAWTPPQHPPENIIELINHANETNPFAYLAIPLLNQTIYVAGCYFVKEIEQLGVSELSNTSETSNTSALRKARKNVLALREALVGQTRFWGGIAWITGSLNQRIEGLMRNNLDLEKITGSMTTSVSLVDEGLIEEHASSVIDVTDGVDVQQEGNPWPSPYSHGEAWSGDSRTHVGPGMSGVWGGEGIQFLPDF